MTSQLRERLRLIRREAEGYLELGMPEHALRSLQRRGQIVHGDARACYLLGESLRELHQYREAIFPLKRSLEIVPDDIHVWMALACTGNTADPAVAAGQPAGVAAGAAAEKPAYVGGPVADGSEALAKERR